MKKRINSTVCRLIILIVLISSPVFAEDWKVLFDGKTLTGWTERSKERCFEVVDGQIDGTMVLNKGTSLLCTDPEEQSNLATKHPVIVARLAKRLAEHRIESTKEAAGRGEGATKADAAEWTKLFDGKSFDGWFQTGGKHTYEIVDGSIVGSAVPKEGNGFMTTQEKYRNFELKFQVKLDHGLNSGCQIRSMPLREKAHLVGPQVEIAGGKSGFIYG
ncbi:MAG: DUF1080 domain-containing protein, partial [Verrucomicrobia bacterium]|nr:DUF1080 domain-containing protein [Verrucomicrobiota bacterium]